MIKDISFAAYILPVRVRNNTQEVALIEYAPGAYGTIGGRFDDGETVARHALKREIIEELGPTAAFMADSAIEISTPYTFKVAENKIEKRGAYNESHKFFIIKVLDNTILEFCEKREANIKIIWLNATALLDEKIIGFPDQRDYFKQYIMPIICKLS